MLQQTKWLFKFYSWRTGLTGNRQNAEVDQSQSSIQQGYGMNSVKESYMEVLCEEGAQLCLEQVSEWEIRGQGLSQILEI